MMPLEEMALSHDDLGTFTIPKAGTSPRACIEGNWKRGSEKVEDKIPCTLIYRPDEDNISTFWLRQHICEFRLVC